MTRDQTGVVSVAGRSERIVNRELWRQLRSGDDPDAYTQSWLLLLCRSIPGCQAGVLVMGEPQIGPFSPVATWPGEDVAPALTQVVEQSLAQGDAVMNRSSEQSAEPQQVAIPIAVAEGVIGVVGVSLTQVPSGDDPIFQLRWASAWIERYWYAEQAQVGESFRENALATFELFGVVLENQGFVGTCRALVTELATRLNCDQVCLGMRNGKQTELIAISHSAQFGQRMNLNKAVTAAMDEALDQSAIVVYPTEADQEYRVVQAHGALSTEHQVDTVMTLPLRAEGELVGAFNLQRARSDVFTDAEIELADTLAALLGPMLVEKQRNDRHLLKKIADAGKTQIARLFGEGFLRRKLFAIAALLLVLLFAFWEGDYRVTAPAQIEGLIQRSVVAPFDGYVASQFYRAGELVAAGDLLAELDDEEIALERIRWSTRERQSVAEYDQALAEQRRADANVIRTEMRQAQAQVALMDAQLARTKIVAPIGGVIVTGDLSQSVGVAINRGQELFRIAPVEQQRVMLEIADADIDAIVPGQTGVLRLESLPDLELHYEVQLVTAVTEQSDGRNYFRVEAALQTPDARLRPGMQGVSKTRIERRLVIQNWTAGLIDWLKLFIWRWSP